MIRTVTFTAEVDALCVLTVRLGGGPGRAAGGTGGDIGLRGAGWGWAARAEAGYFVFWGILPVPALLHLSLHSVVVLLRLTQLVFPWLLK